uniref:HAD family hydrolase n=1 Tax=Archaeoglobus fulgidus TaxID=2234 RepID=A0A7J2TIP4_ARCFL
MKWWAIEAGEVLKILETTPQGLKDDERKRRIERFGLNEVKGREKSPMQILIKQVLNPLILILVISMITFLYLDHLSEAVIVLIIVVVSILVGFLQEWKAENIMRELKRLLMPKSLVLIDGKVKEIDSRFIVPGDVILIEAGMKIPADARLIEAKELSVDESILTGESFPVEKRVEKIEENTPLPERTCMIYAGTLATTGWGKAVVVATGNNTELGKISKSLEEIRVTKSPLVIKLERFAKQLSIGIALISVFIFLVGIFRGYDAIYVLTATLSFAVAVIPEILPATVTLALAFGVREMAKANALVKSLPAVESLGSVDTICTDKTGTLTQNSMKVVKLVSRDGEEVDAEDDEKLSKVKDLILAGYICNRAVCESGTCRGDPMEVALLQIALKTGFIAEFELVDEIPFDSKRKFMAVSAKLGDDYLIVVKGAPEALEKILNIKMDVEKYAEQGMRILAFAWKKVKKFEGFSFDGLEFLGFQCLIDPLREDVRDSVEKCKSAGIEIYMITGDHPSTSKTIANWAGIEGEVISGKELAETDIEEAVKKYRIFARITPEQKLEIVSALQKNGKIVAVTGDGVNDGPALKKAEIGVAIGSGSEVAKEASDIVILDDSFSTIVKAIELGRDVFRKIQRIISWTLPTNGGQGLVVMFAFLLGIQMPMMPVHILWINTITAGLLGMMIVFEKREEGLLRLKPTRGEIMNFRIFLRIIYISILSLLIAYYLYFTTGKMSSAVNGIIAVGAWYLLTPYVDKSFFEVGFRNRFALLGIILVFAIQFTITSLGIMNLEPMSLYEWALTILAASSVFAAVEIEKRIKLKSRA